MILVPGVDLSVMVREIQPLELVLNVVAISFPPPEESGSSLTAEEDDGEQSSGKEQRSLGSPRQSNRRLNGLAKRFDVGPPFEKRYQKNAA